jgi:SAM-dependent methyltransferase
MWALAAFVTFDTGLSRPAPLPTPRFLESGSGRVLDGGAGSGRSTLMVLLARPRATVVALDLFREGYGIGGNAPDRLRANARAAGAENRLEIRTGDVREMPFEADSFDAAVSAYVIDHLNRKGTQATYRRLGAVRLSALLRPHVLRFRARQVAPAAHRSGLRHRRARHAARDAVRSRAKGGEMTA